MERDDYTAHVVHVMDQGGEAFVELARHAARAYMECVKEGMPPAKALYLVCDMLRGARGASREDMDENGGP